jgi:putative spermidine/putrescine transport system permease protein
MTATTVTASRAKSSASLSHRLAERGVTARLLLLVPAVVFALGLFVYPFLYGLGLTFQPLPATQAQWGGGLLANYLAFFRDAFTFDSVWITMRLALPVALFPSRSSCATNSRESELFKHSWYCRSRSAPC